MPQHTAAQVERRRFTSVANTPISPCADADGTDSLSSPLSSRQSPSTAAPVVVVFARHADRRPRGLPLGRGHIPPWVRVLRAACDACWLDSDFGRMESVAIGSTASASSAESVQSAEAEPPAQAAASDSAHSHSAHASLSGLAAKWGQGTTEFAEMMRLASKDWRMLILFKIFSFVPLVRWDTVALCWRCCARADAVHRTARARAVRSRSPASGYAVRSSTECERAIAEISNVREPAGRPWELSTLSQRHAGTCCYGGGPQVLKRTLPQPPSIEEMIERLPTLGQRTSNASFVTVGGCVRVWIAVSVVICPRNTIGRRRLPSAAPAADRCKSARGAFYSCRRWQVLHGHPDPVLRDAPVHADGRRVDGEPAWHGLDRLAL